MKSLTHRDQKLVAELRAHIRGEVGFDNGSRALYSTDASNRQIPVGVVLKTGFTNGTQTMKVDLK